MILIIIQILIIVIITNKINKIMDYKCDKYARDVYKNVNTLNYNNYELRYFLTNIYVGRNDFYKIIKLAGVKELI